MAQDLRRHAEVRFQRDSVPVPRRVGHLEKHEFVTMVLRGQVDLCALVAAPNRVRTEDASIGTPPWTRTLLTLIVREIPLLS